MLSTFFKSSPSKPIDFSFFPSLNQNLFIHSTPFFLTNKSIVKNRLLELHQTMSQFHLAQAKIAYSFKTNYDVAKNIRFDMAEVVSQRELKMSLHNHYHYSQIIFNGPNKGNFLPLLYRPITLNLDHFSEIENLPPYSSKITAKIGLRFNSLSSPSRFGFNLENGQASQAFSLLKQKKYPLSGIHFHLGSDIQNSDLYQQCSLAISSFIKKHHLFADLVYIDFGGGFPSHGLIHQTDIQSLPKISNYINSIVQPLSKIVDFSKTEIILEPGRYLVDDSTVMITKVLSTIETSNHQLITVDAANTMLPSTWYRRHLIKNLSANNNFKTIETIIYGSSCQETDILYRGKFQKVSIGDLLVFYCVGAYNQSQTSSFIFNKPKTYFIYD